MIFKALVLLSVYINYVHEIWYGFLFVVASYQNLVLMVPLREILNSVQSYIHIEELSTLLNDCSETWNPELYFLVFFWYVCSI